MSQFSESGLESQRKSSSSDDDYSSSSDDDDDDHIVTHGTTIAVIKTKELVIAGCDSRGSHNRSHRIMEDDSTKVEKLISDIYVTHSGGKKASIVLFADMRKQYEEKKNSGVNQTLKELANYGLQHIRNLNKNSKAKYTVIGTENGMPQSYQFLDDGEYKDVTLLTKWFVHGSGARYTGPFLEDLNSRGTLSDMSEDNGLHEMETTLLNSVLSDPSSGGFVRVYVFGSTGLIRDFHYTTLELYLKHYNLYEDIHARTIYTFSRGQIGNDLVTQWFSEGCLIEPVAVTVVHPIGYIGDYTVSRVVLENREASAVYEEVLNERFHFAVLTKEELRALLL